MGRQTKYVQTIDYRFVGIDIQAGAFFWHASQEFDINLRTMRHIPPSIAIYRLEIYDMKLAYSRRHPSGRPANRQHAPCVGARRARSRLCAAVISASLRGAAT